jgi:hypothetical protein
MPDRLKVAPVPAAFDRPLRLWAALARHREPGFGASVGFSWRDFAAFCAVTGEVLFDHDIRLISAIEDAFQAARKAGDERRAKQKAKDDKVKP